MINSDSLQAIRERYFGNNFVKPLYEGYGFAQLPQTIRSLLIGGEPIGIPFGDRADLYGEYDTVILFFIDAFGWRFVERYSDHPFIQRFVREGLINKLTSQFPSTTAAHVTSIHTGLEVGQSGVYEWNYYEPLLDAIITPLMYSFAGDHDRETLKQTGIDPSRLFPNSTLYHELANHGVRSHVIQDERYTDSPYTEIVTNGANLIPYKTLPDALASLWEAMDVQRLRSYYFFYYDKIDSICHTHGPNSSHLEAEIRVFLDTMESLLHTSLQGCSGKTLFLMTADHAQVEIDPATTVYISQTLPELLPLLRRNGRGQLLAPAGSARDLFLHVRDDEMEVAQAMLRHHLAGKAEVWRTTDLMADGFFGSASPSSALRSRIGDLVVLPYAHESVWWFEPGRFEQKFYGSHGGLTREEMETVLLVQQYGS